MNPFDKAFLIRILATIVVLVFIRQYFGKADYLLLTIIFSLTDSIDSEFVDVNTFDYKIRDKIADAFSYILAYALFSIDKTFLYYLIYRVVGVILFGIKRDVRWLIICPDMMKEYLIFSLLYKGNTSSFPVLIPVKMLFEIWHHTISDPMTNPTQVPLTKKSPPPSLLQSLGLQA